MLLLIDNYDSFTYNLVHYLGELGAKTTVRRNDQLTPEEAIAMQPDGIVLSPGPCDPNKAGICLELVKTAAPEIPMLGVCLGHQAIGQAFGARIIRANEPMHGKTSNIRHDGSGIFKGLPENFFAVRYHSLVIDADSLPDMLQVTAQTDDGTIMGIRHNNLPVFGVQFHPESIDTASGHALLSNFIDMTRKRRDAA